ncbi:hypothetical protein [Pontiella sulfatireligans]|uniref:Uncharacterized protein n=1 Tax=Pontiella sulfatireligans TaxID=2750658 RepID=A0A6C2UH32_9BACT|nr:hypothetical protein [Pontiella sulfatireligans]VGO19239.1 hypothetical protein SCARR_01296 [Pontiella sulfatireligans]
MFKIQLLFLVCLTAVASADDVVVLDNGVMRMEINRMGGAVSSCVLAGSELNPFSWRAKRWNKNDRSVKEGLFTCFDRLGQPSPEDKARGIPFHGEAASVEWKVLGRETSVAGHLLLRMQCILPIAGMTLAREYCLFKDSSVCRVRDRIRNDNPFPKTYNLLIHPSHAQPFLSRSVLVDCNGATGFVNSKEPSEIPGDPICWPEIEYQSQRLNLRTMTNGVPLVVNYLCAKDVTEGWGCLSNPDLGLMTGFIWPVSDYPWTRIWQEWKDGAPSALGIEFSTTPLGFPLEEIERIGPLLGHPTIETLSPGGEVTKTFHFFLLEIPREFSGVGVVRIADGSLIVEEHSGADNRCWVVPFAE